MIQVVKTTAGGVPGGHWAIAKVGKKAFISPTREYHSVPIQSFDIVIDIGAYVGTFALWAAKMGARLVRAYEPTPFSFDVLKRNIDESGLNIIGIPSAIVNDAYADRFVQFKMSEGMGVTNGLVGKKRKEKIISVPVVRFSEAIADATIIKVDVEGAEYLYDFKSLPIGLRAVIIDFHPAKQDWIQSAESIIVSLKDQGFRDVIIPKWQNGWTRAGSWVRP